MKVKSKQQTKTYTQNYLPLLLTHFTKTDNDFNSKKLKHSL